MRRVLIIDDQKYVRDTIALTLGANGFEIVSVETGHAGLLALEQQQIDIAIVDVFMPNMDGVKTIKALRKKSPNLAVIAISGVLMRASGRTALDFLPMSPNLHGVVCLQKPFRPRDLLKAVDAALLVKVH